MVAGWSTSSSAVLVCTPKPTPVTMMVYLAGGTCVNTYSPLPFATAVNVCPFALSVSEIFAPGTSAPLGSLTTPRSEVFAFWENTRVAAERIQKSIHPFREFFTAVPPELILLQVFQKLLFWFEFGFLLQLFNKPYHGSF
jgi:hypothetical protein